MLLLLSFQHRSTTSELASNITTFVRSAIQTKLTLDERYSCTLSPRARASSTVLSAVIGTILDGISNGHLSAFVTVYVCWLATLRILIVGTYYMVRACQLHPLHGGDDFFHFIQVVHCLGAIPFLDNPLPGRGIERTKPTVPGWISWFYSCCYAPVMQMLWLVENWSKANSGLKVARAAAASVAAIPSTTDTKARYGKAMGERFGSRFAIVFTFVTAGSTLLLGLVAVIELSLAAHQGDFSPGVIVAYVFFTLLWTYISFLLMTPHDKSIDMTSNQIVLVSLKVALFGSLFTAGPTLLIWLVSSDVPGVGLGEYVKCGGVA